MPSKTWATGRPKKQDYEACWTNPNGSVTCEGAQKSRGKKAKNKAKAKKVKKTGGKMGKKKKGESTKDIVKKTGSEYKEELGKTLKEMTTAEKRIYNNLKKAESRARRGQN